MDRPKTSVDPEPPAFEAESIEILSTEDELFSEILEQPPAAPCRSRLDDWVDLRLTVDQAGLIYEKLRRTVEGPLRRRPARDLKAGEIITDPQYLLEVVREALDALLPTARTASSRGNVHVRERDFLVRVRRHEAAYFWRIIKNHELDEERRKAFEEDLFMPLEVVELAEEGLEPEELTDGVRRAFIYPIHHDNPGAHQRRFFLKGALSELPAVLKMSEGEVDELLSALGESGGNVSEAARQTGQPQRKTARRIARLLRHLKNRGFSA